MFLGQDEPEPLIGLLTPERGPPLGIPSFGPPFGPLLSSLFSGLGQLQENPRIHFRFNTLSAVSTLGHCSGVDNKRLQ